MAAPLATYRVQMHAGFGFDAAAAIADYLHALGVSPFDPTTRCGLAEAYTQTNDPRAPRERAACDQLKN